MYKKGFHNHLIEWMIVKLNWKSKAQTPEGLHLHTINCNKLLGRQTLHLFRIEVYYFSKPVLAEFMLKPTVLFRIYFKASNINDLKTVYCLK